MIRCSEVRLELPWYLNGTLPARERALVEAHLSRCGACRDECCLERRVVTAVRADTPRVVPAPAWREFERALDIVATADTLERAQERVDDRAVAPRRQRPRSLRSSYAVAVAAQLAAIALLTALIGFRLETPAPRVYRTLTTPDPAAALGGPLLQVVVSTGTSAGEVRDIALRAGAVVVSSSRETLFLFAPIDGRSDIEAIAAALRADPRVRLVEPLSLDRREPDP